jgi:hypothetical protein
MDHNLKLQVYPAIEHVFDWQKAAMGLIVRTIGIARVTTKSGVADAPNSIGLTLRAAPNDHIGITVDARSITRAICSTLHRHAVVIERERSHSSPAAKA